MRRVAAIFGILAFVLTGCQHLTESSTPSPQASPVFSEATYLSWQPETKVVLPTYTEEEALKIRETWLRDQEIEGTENLPIPELVRWIKPGDWQTLSDCLNDAGFANRVGDNGSGVVMSGAAPRINGVAPDLVALWQCMAQYTFEAGALTEETPEQAAVYYEYFTTYYLDCLDAQGIHLDRSAIPSKEQWITATLTHEDTWSPTTIDEWDSQSRSHLNEAGGPAQLARLCPMKPPNAAYYGTD